MPKIYIFFFKVVKTNPTKERFDKPKQEKFLSLIPENIGDRKLSVCKTIKHQLNIEKVQSVSRIKYFKPINFFN